ncbi:hypothetical protein ACVWZZ_006857 [Bradyrhizobium sp. LM6.10]
MRVINFAHGDFMMLGMYVAFYLFTAAGIQTLFGNTVGPFVAILLAGPVLAVFGYFVHLALISHVSGTRTASLEGEGHYAQLILTLGIALILQNGGLIVFGSVLASIRTPLSSTAWELGPYFDMSIFLNKARSIDAIVSLAIMTLLSLLIARTRIGKSLRAAPPTIRPPRPIWASTSTAPIAPPLHWAAASRRSPAACSQPTIRSTPSSASNTSSSCMPVSCSAAWAASSAPSGAG